MAAKRKTPATDGCCDVAAQSCCRVDSLVTVDERGQMILPKELRERAGIKGGEKLAVIACEAAGIVCCLCLVKAEALGGYAKAVLGPLLKEIAP
ncbi:MAG: AbrB/MazE/SpoVT family DNA-binding domain-containing protein [Planctomycetes bacterium]|nr:AbrB/MazE/SpoVT family DNA-binding domain-containing protein [Planctomycetota bacterium]